MSTISTVFLFVIGDSPRDLKLRLANEQKLFQDILRVDFSDTYHNLTLKIQFAFHWAVSHCGHFDYVIKIDDDVYMNMHLFLEMVLGLHPKEPVFGGKCYLSAKPNRDPRNKWFLSPKLFKGRFLPPLCLGPMYFMSMDVVNAIYREFSYVQRLWLEDVYIGLCAQRASIIPNKNLTEQVVNWLPDKNPTIRYPTKVIAVHFSGFYPAIVHFHVMIETALAKNKFVRKFKILGRSRMRPESWRFEVT